MKDEKTLVILKPDAVQRSLMGDIISRIERTGLKMIAAKFIMATREQALSHYNKDEAWFLKVGNKTIENRKNKNLPIEKEAIDYGKDMLEANVSFITAGPILVMVFEGNKSVGIVKKLVGGTEPLTSDVGTIRSDYTIDSYELANIDQRCVRNLVHCSDEASEAQREIKIWFKDDEIIKYTHLNEKILYDVNLDGIVD
ncbi:MAG TPA: nucleoside-diphosphate kinase [bacterium]|jgi:nucleoside-diphosphate kinase|nr:nucleoside-diphosphate kinase [bacterium]HOG38752.1 nucleoside-diphosphate kinase [bacterium]HQI03590.1 nucleoside-diphosphate kinase [bacterium]